MAPGLSPAGSATPPPEGIVLAAGWSRRMGHPKALTPIGGEPAVARVVRACRDAGCATVAVVAPPGVPLPPLDARVLVNPDPDAGRTGSLQLALRGVADALVWPVDHPLAGAETARLLLATPGDWVVPTFNGRGGHPVVLRGEAVDLVRAAAPSAPLREVLRGARRVDVLVGDGKILANLDAPGDLARHSR